MAIVIDRRNIGENTAVNVQRYIRRRQRVVNGDISNGINNNNDFEHFVHLITPMYAYDNTTGYHDKFFIGNKTYVRGDIIYSSDDEDAIYDVMGSGSGGDGDEGGEGGESDITTDSDVLNSVFNVCKLPNLTKKSQESEEVEIVRAGYSTSGGIVDFRKTFLNSIGRRMAMRNPIRKELEQAIVDKDEKKIKELEERMRAIPYVDDMDVRYNRYDELSVPSKKMVLFLILDVSGSMFAEHRRLARIFSRIVLKFLERHYNKCQVEYIIFSTDAEVVSQSDFFDNRKSGGTIIGSALDKLDELYREKYDESWNAYTVLYTDSETTSKDISYCSKMLKDTIVPYMQYFIYAHTVGEEYELALQIGHHQDPSKYYTAQLYEDSDIIDEFMKAFGGEV